MKRSLFIFSLLLFLLTPLRAYSASPREDEISAIRSEILAESERIRGIDCDFTQTRESVLLARKAVSTGHMTYRKPGKLQWEYLSPMKMKFTLDGKKVTLERDGQPLQGGGNQSRAIREIARMIISLVEGRSLFDGKTFTSEITPCGEKILVTLTPLNQQMKKMWTSLTLTYDRRTKRVVEFKMNEPSGDTTLITFLNARYEYSE